MRRSCPPHPPPLVVCCAAAIALAACSRVIGEGDYQPFPDAGGDTLPDREIGPPEVCDFRDDDLDGLVDQGFAWSVGAWHDVATLDRADAVRAARLPDGSVTLAVRGASGGGEGVSVAVVDAHGKPLHGPTFVKTSGKVSGFGIAARWDGTVGVATFVDDGNGCPDGCPITLSQFDGALHSVASGAVAFDKQPGALAFVPHGLLDLSATSAGFVVLAVDENARARVGWVAQTNGHFPNAWNGVISGLDPVTGSLAPGPALAWAALGPTEGGPVQVLFGCSTAGGYHELTPPSLVVGEPGAQPPVVATDASGVAWLGANPVVIATFRPTAARTQPSLYKMSGADGTVVTSSSVGAEGREAHSVVSVGDNVVATTTGHNDFDVHRFGPSLAKVDDPDHPIVVEDASAHAIAGGDGAPVLIRIATDGRSVSAAALACP